MGKWMKEISKSLTVNAPIEAVYKFLREDSANLRLTQLLSDLTVMGMKGRVASIVDAVPPSRLIFE